MLKYTKTANPAIRTHTAQGDNMSDALQVAEAFIQLFRRIRSLGELEVAQMNHPSMLTLTRSNRYLQYRISVSPDDENGGAINDFLLTTQRYGWHGDTISETYFQDHLGCLAILRKGLSVFGDLNIQCLVTEVSGPMLSVDISAAKHYAGPYQKIATVLVDQVKDQITDIELSPLD